jgi:hypothetical protein
MEKNEAAPEDLGYIETFPEVCPQHANDPIQQLGDPQSNEDRGEDHDIFEQIHEGLILNITICRQDEYEAQR